MIINVFEAQNAAGTLRTFHFITSTKELALDDDQPGVNTPVSVSGTVMANGSGLEISGVIETIGAYQCDRCLENYTVPLKIPFAETYREGDKAEADTSDSSYFQGDEIDISELVRESILLAQPLKKLCSENCKGLCPQCGTNLNLAKCTCERSVIDPRLAALQQLLPK
ncbi:MAG: DUF177 domain-containing protein [Veillonellales bacterium]